MIDEPIRRAASFLVTIARKDPFYKPDLSLTTWALTEILSRRAVEAARGVTLKARVAGVTLPFFVGRGVKVIGGRQVRLGRGCLLQDYVLIDAISKYGVNLGDSVTLDRFVTVRCTGTIHEVGAGVTIGNNSSLGAYSYLGGTGGLVIGNNVLGGQRLSFHPENHVFNDTERTIKEQGSTKQGIAVEDDCWLGSGAIFLDGVTVGRGSVIAAGSVVNTDIPPFSVAGRVPARVIRSRFASEEAEKGTGERGSAIEAIEDSGAPG